jgi:penicillin amidase
MLLSWNGAMDADSPAAALWWTFLDRYLHDTFDPWWKAYHVPSGKYDSLSVRPGLAPLVEDIETWTLHDRSNPAFSLPDGKKRTARDVIRKALTEAVGDLTKRFGSTMSTWRWGRLHTREFPSLAQIPGLGYGPRASGSDLWTVNAASGEFQSEAGPSWRMIVDWGSGMAEGVYPGGQSENPASPWYENEIANWWSGTYHVLTDAAAAQRHRDVVTWSLEP